MCLVYIFVWAGGRCGVLGACPIRENYVLGWLRHHCMFMLLLFWDKSDQSSLQVKPLGVLKLLHVLKINSEQMEVWGKETRLFTLLFRANSNATLICLCSREKRLILFPLKSYWFYYVFELSLPWALENLKTGIGVLYRPTYMQYVGLDFLPSSSTGAGSCQAWCSPDPAGSIQNPGVRASYR